MATAVAQYNNTNICETRTLCEYDSRATTIAVYDFKDSTPVSGPLLLLSVVMWTDGSSSKQVHFRYIDCGVFGQEMSVRSELQMRSLMDVPNTDYPRVNKHFLVLKGVVDVPTILIFTDTLSNTIDSYFPSRVLYNYIESKRRGDSSTLLKRLSTYCWNVLCE